MAARDRIIHLLLAILIVNLFVLQGGIGQKCWDGTKNRIYADSIIEKIGKGEDVNCGPDSMVVGDLIFDKINNKSIKGNIEIHSEICGKIIARNKDFLGLVDLSNSNFNENVSFEGSAFFRDAYFYKSNFKKELFFTNAAFLNGSSFDGMVCDMSAEFLNTSFKGDSTFYKAIFDGRADFSLCRFQGNGQFQLANFKERSLFHGSKFLKEANFFASEFAKDAEFHEAEFNGDAIFKSIKCNGALYFNKNQDFRLGGAAFSKLVFFDRSYIRYLDINGSVFSENCKISFNDCDFFRLNAMWDNIREHVPFDEEVYIHLFNYYKGVAQFNDADACYLEYNLKSKKESWRDSAISHFLGITCIFGTSVWRVISFLAGLALIFAFLYYNRQSIRRKDCPHCYLSFWDCLYYSLMVLVNFSADYTTQGKWRWLVLFERLLGWILLAILVITIVRLGLR